MAVRLQKLPIPLMFCLINAKTSCFNFGIDRGFSRRQPGYINTPETGLSRAERPDIQTALEATSEDEEGPIIPSCPRPTETYTRGIKGLANSPNQFLAFTSYLNALDTTYQKWS